MGEQERERAGGQAEAAKVSLLDEIMQETKIKPADESYDIAKRGLEAFLKHVIDRKVVVKQAIVNDMIVEIDTKLSKQLDVILHHPQFQKLESSWRGLKLLVDRTDFRENNKIEILNVSKEDLLSDFEDSPEIVKSGLYKLVYTENYGVFGGEPVGAMVANFEFGPGPQDVSLLQYCASVAGMSHAPFISAAGPQFFGESSFLKLPNLKDLKGIFKGLSTPSGTRSASPRTRATSASPCRASSCGSPSARRR